MRLPAVPRNQQSWNLALSLLQEPVEVCTAVLAVAVRLLAMSLALFLPTLT